MIQLASNQAAWRVRVLGALSCHLGNDVVIDRFRTRKAASLFAYLALHLNRTHAREELAEMIWPDSEPESGRNSLKQELAALRRQLEPCGRVEAGSVLIADRTHVRLNPQTVECDAERFVSLVKRANRAKEPNERRDLLERALAEFGGELLPGSYDDWALGERSYLSGLYASAAKQLAEVNSELGNPDIAIGAAAEAAKADPWDAKLQEKLLEMLWNAGRYREMLLHYRQMKSRLAEISVKPSPRCVDLMRKARDAGHFEFEEETAKGEADPPLQAQIPITYSRFFGREEEMSQLLKLLRDKGVRLVNLTGPGGVGKTRLAIEASRQIVADRNRPVVFIALASCADGSRLPERLADELKISIRQGESPIDSISRELKGVNLFLVLDNFEQIIAPGAAVVNELLARVKSIKILVTSRRRLLIGPEIEFVVKPFSLPCESTVHEVAVSSPAVQLFLDRASSVLPDFALTPTNFDAVRSLCAALEGLPLAIEMAARRVRSMSPVQMLSMLNRRFDLLRGQQRDVDARHQTLWAAIDWSVQMLSDSSKQNLAVLATFVGGFNLEMAETLLGPDALDSIEELMENNLLVRIESEQRTIRYRLYEMVREFALERLSPEQLFDVKDRHSKVFETLVEAAEPHSYQSDRPDWYEKLTVEMDNILTCLDWLTDSRQRDRGLKVSSQLWRFFHSAGRGSEARQIIEGFLGHAERPTSLVEARAWNAAGILACYESDYESCLRYMDGAIPILKKEGDFQSLVSAQVNLGDVELYGGRYAQAIPFYEEAARTAQSIDYVPGYAICCQGIGIVHMVTQEYREAEKWFEKSLEAWQRIDFELGESYALGGMAGCASHLKEFDRASVLHRRVLEVQQRLGDKPGISVSLYNIGDLAREMGDFEEARRFFFEAAEMMLCLHQVVFLSYALDSLGYTTWQIGDPTQAAVFLGAAARLRRDAKSPLPDEGENVVAPATLGLREKMGEDAFQAAWKEGNRTSLTGIKQLLKTR